MCVSVSERERMTYIWEKRREKGRHEKRNSSKENCSYSNVFKWMCSFVDFNSRYDRTSRFVLASFSSIAQHVSLWMLLVTVWWLWRHLFRGLLFNFGQKKTKKKKSCFEPFVSLLRFLCSLLVSLQCSTDVSLCSFLHLFVSIDGWLVSLILYIYTFHARFEPREYLTRNSTY